MTIVNIHEAKTRLSKLINQALAGEEVVIARGNKLLIRLVPFQQQMERKGGQLKGIIQIEPNCDEPLPEELFKKFND